MLLIEHNGTKEHVHISKFISDYISDNFGISSDYIIGHKDDPVNIYNDDMQPLASFSSKPTPEILNFYLGVLIDGDMI